MRVELRTYEMQGVRTYSRNYCVKWRKWRSLDRSHGTVQDALTKLWYRWRRFWLRRVQSLWRAVAPKRTAQKRRSEAIGTPLQATRKLSTHRLATHKSRTTTQLPPLVIPGTPGKHILAR